MNKPREIKFLYEGVVPSKSNNRGGRSPAEKAARQRVRAYQADIGNLAMVSGAKRMPQDHPVEVHLEVINQGCDLDNVWKATLDAMKGVAYNDDDQVVRQSAEEFWDEFGPAIYVRVRWRPKGRCKLWPRRTKLESRDRAKEQ